MKNVDFRAYHKIEKRIINIHNINFIEETVGHDAQGNYSDVASFDQIELQQFTGFYTSHADKYDADGIYEGDTIIGETRNDPKKPIFEGIVEWHEPTGGFVARDKDGFTRGLNSFYNLKIK